MLRYFLIFLTVMACFTGGCSTMKRPMPPLASIEGVPGHFQVGRIISTETGKTISFNILIDQLGSKDLIFIGEVHDNPEHHLIQVQMLQALMARYGPVSASMEFFQDNQQPVIDQYLEGKLSEEEFLKDVNWEEKWSFDYHFYRPLVLLLKDKGSKIFAINAPNDIVKRVARSGLESLDKAERNQLAANIDLSNEGHRAFLREIYEEHTHQDLDDFDFFYQAQCVWEDSMAENIAAHLKKINNKMVVFTGNGHIINKFGIPDRTSNRIQVKMATVLLYPLETPSTIKKEMADFVWLTGNHSQRRFKTYFKHPKHHKRLPENK